MSETARYYTRGVRFPRLVGRTHDGTKIPGGPYTMLQVVGGLGVFLVGEFLRPLWGTSNLLQDYGLLLTAVVGTVVGLRFVRPGGRNPVTVAMALLSVYTQPRTGRLHGRALRFRAPHRVRGRVTLTDLPARRSTASVQAAPARRTRSTSARPTSTSPRAAARRTAAPLPSGPPALEELSAIGRRLAAASRQPPASPRT